MKHTFSFKKGMAAALVAAVTAVASLPSQMLGFAADAVPAADATWEENLSLLASSSVSITKSAGYFEGAYAEWQPVSGADGYNVYCDGVQLDSMLIRQYKDGHLRADALGLKAGSHTLKVVPVNGSSELSGAAEATVSVEANDRSGFGFVKGTSSGAYNEDGTLREDAVVVYVTNENKDTVTASLNAEGKGNVTVTGVQAIINAYKKGKETRPLCLRIIGNITDPSVLTKGDLYVDTAKAGMTIEGVGNDAVLNGFGLVMKNCSNIEVRNLGFMNCNSSEGDDCGLQQGNDHIWVHNCDFFYGDAGSDADQVKGDGALDTKKSTYVTHSYNHFWDNGKCNLQGMKSETETNYITYHHNWYDHSDSRHPRIRTCSVHSYNNYFDGNAKYGVGVTMGASAFVENNYFRNCKDPMMSSGQGTDALGEGTFSGEPGGIIKAYNNVIVGASSYIPYAENNTSFDAYEVSSPSETIPSSVTALSGGSTYNNFDTDSSIMYSYTADAPEDVPSIVTAHAGRVDGGDFQWKFDNAVDDTSYAVNQELKNALVAYTSSIAHIGSGFSDSGNTPQVTETKPATTTTSTTTTTITTTKGGVVTTVPAGTTTKPTPIAGALYCAPNAKGVGTMDDPMDIYEAIQKVSAGQTIYLLDGTYELSEMIVIDSSNNGAENAYKTISAYPGATVKLDFSGQGAADGSKRGVVLDGDYWKFYGFEITKAADNGMLLAGNHNRIENMVFNDNQDTGLQISRYNTSAATIADWPSYNLILNCTSKNNCDNASMENADGFAAKLTCGEGNVFDGCMAYNNSDDGWDLFAKAATGPIGIVTIQNCVAFRNGFTEFGEGYGNCDGNGFKLGGSGIGSAHVVKNCLSFENLHCGFTDNNNPKLGTLINCTAINNNGEGTGKPNFSCYRCTDPGCDFDNLMSYYDASIFLSDAKLKGGASNDKYVGTYNNGVYYNSGYYLVESDTAITNGAKIGTKFTGPTASDFIALTKAPEQGTDFHKVWRNADGSLNLGGLYETKTDGKYGTMGYHLSNSDTPIVTTTTTSGQNPTTTTTTTTVKPTTTTSGKQSETPTPSGAQIHDFTANGKNSSFYTITGNLATNKGTVSYNGLTLTQCLKMESATSVGFTNTAKGDLTLVFVEPNATIKVDGTKYTANGDGIIQVSVSAGTHTITKANTANLYYMVYADQGGTVVTTTTTATTAAPTTKPTAIATTTTTTTIDEEGLNYGDVNLDGVVDIRDCVTTNKFLANVLVLSDIAQKNADVDRDGNVGDIDVNYLMRFILNCEDVPNLPV